MSSRERGLILDYPAAPPATRRAPDFKVLALTLLALFSLCFNLGAMPLQSPDEGRYAEAAREMLETGDWLIPHFGYVERVNKPPLFYWAAAVSMRLLGVNETAARLPSLLAALATVLILYLLARRAWDEDTGHAAALVLMTSLFFAALARIAITDMLLCLCLTAAVAALWWAIRDRSVPATLLFFVAAAAGTLTKGPIALALPALIGLLFLTLTRQWRQVRWGAVAAGIVLYAVLAIPWFAAVQLRYPGFLHYFFIGENVQRFAGNEHPEPVWFYIPILVVGFGVWIPTLVTAPWTTGRRPRDLPTSDPSTLFALIWAGTIFAFFSLSSGKLPTYVLPCFPPLALLIGRQWARRDVAEGKTPAWTRWHAGLLAVGLAVVAVATYVLIPQRIGLTSGALTSAASTIGCAALLAGYGAVRGNTCTRFGAVAAAGALLTFGVTDAATQLLWSSGSAGQTLARLIVTRAPSDTRLYTYKEDGLTSLRFYMGQAYGTSRRLQDIPALERPRIDGGEARRGPRRRTSTSSALAEALKRPGSMLFVMRKDDYDRIRPLLLSSDADRFSSDVGKYAVRGRLTSAPLSGKRPGREPATSSTSLKVR